MRTDQEIKDMLDYMKSKLEHARNNSHKGDLQKLRVVYTFEGFCDALEWVLEEKK